MIKINVQVTTDREYWGEAATEADGQAAAEKLVEMIEEYLADWKCDANVEIADPAHGQAADDVQVITDSGRRSETLEGEIKAYIEDNWRTALDSVA